jgi:hypothetical protein
VLRMERFRTPVAVLCIALVVCAVFVPGTASMLRAIVLLPIWIAPAPLRVAIAIVVVDPGDRQSEAQRDLVAPRPPPPPSFS